MKTSWEYTPCTVSLFDEKKKRRRGQDRKSVRLPCRDLAESCRLRANEDGGGGPGRDGWLCDGGGRG